MALNEVERERWFAFLEQFGLEHRRWLVTMERTAPDGRRETLAHEVPLESIRLSGQGDVVTLLGAKGKAGPQQEMVRSPRRILLSSRADGVHEGLQIEDTAGLVTHVRFRATNRPEHLNGIV